MGFKFSPMCSARQDLLSWLDARGKGHSFWYVYSVNIIQFDIILSLSLEAIQLSHEYSYQWPLHLNCS